MNPDIYNPAVMLGACGICMIVGAIIGSIRTRRIARREMNQRLRLIEDRFSAELRHRCIITSH